MLIFLFMAPENWSFVLFYKLIDLFYFAQNNKEYV